MGARFVARFEVGEVEGVGLAASTQSNVDPFPVVAAIDDHEGAPGGDALSLVSGEGVAAINVAVLEVPEEADSSYRGSGRDEPPSCSGLG